MKKIILFIIAMILLVPSVVFAESGKITISGANQVVVGNKVTITVKLSTGASWEMDLNYDKSFLQLVSGGGEAGGTNMVNTSTGKPNRTYTFTFKALKSGSTSIKIGSYYVVDDSFGTVSISTSAKSLKIITQAELEASYSKDNNLKSLTVEGYELTPEFSKDVTEYSINVPEGTKIVKIVATPNDSKSDVSGTGDIEVSEGINNITITVKAENGSEKKYTIAVNVIDTNPINVIIDDTNYTVVKLRDNYACVSPFEQSELTIEEQTIPTCYNEKINYYLVGLKDTDGNINSYIYDNGNYYEYKEVTSNSLKIIVLDYGNVYNKYEKTTVKINDNNYSAFKYDNNSNNYVVYGMDILTGQKDFYLYDNVNNVFSAFDEDYFNDISKKQEMYLYIIIAFGAGLFLTIICVISLIIQKNKLKKHMLNMAKIDEFKEKKKK